jgi:hypothetical protein
MLTKNSSLVISISKVQNELKKFKKEIVSFDKSKLEPFYSSLSLDIGILLNLFKIKENDDYELKFLIGVFLDVSILFGQSENDIDGISLVSNWNKLSSSQKEQLKKPVLELKKSSDFFYSIQLTKETNGLDSSHLKKIILLISDYLINADGIKTDFEIKRRIEIENIINNSSEKIGDINKKKIKELFKKNSIDTRNEKVFLTKFDDLKKVLALNQKHLIQFDEDFIRKIILTFKFLNDLEKDIRILEEKLNNSKSLELTETFFETLFSQVRTFNYLFLMISKQIENALNKDYISYYEMNTIFDSMGIYISASEKTTHDLLNKISDGQVTLSNQLNLISSQLSSIELGINSLNQNVVKLTRSVMSLEMTMKDGFKEMSNNLQSIGNSINQGFNSLSTNLDKINSSIQYNNLITTINAYQNYRVNSKVTKLLG